MRPRALSTSIWHFWSLLLAVLLVGPFMSQADATIVNVATPSIRADLGASGTTLELVVGGYLIAFAPAAGGGEPNHAPAYTGHDECRSLAASLPARPRRIRDVVSASLPPLHRRLPW
jgi:hypothetical protein